MNPEEYYDKNNTINANELDRCLEDAECFDDFVDLLTRRDLLIHLDTASDLWQDYITN